MYSMKENWMSPWYVQNLHTWVMMVYNNMRQLCITPLHRRDGLSPRRQHQGPWQEVVRLQPHGGADQRTVAKNALVEYNNLIFGS